MLHLPLKGEQFTTDAAISLVHGNLFKIIKSRQYFVADLTIFSKTVHAWLASILCSVYSYHVCLLSPTVTACLNRNV